MQFEALVHKIDPTYILLRTWQPAGGSAAQVTALEVACADGRRQKFIVRQHSEWARNRNPHIASQEFRLLQLLYGAGLAVPRPYHVEPAGPLCAIPALVLDYMVGETDYAPPNVIEAAAQMAQQLARIHAIDGVRYDLSFLPRPASTLIERFGEPPTGLDPDSDVARIRRVLADAWPPPRMRPLTVLHGDFWPGNILWRNGQLVGIIDWEDAKVGDPLEDVAISRFDICFIFGRDAMHAFTQHYQALAFIDEAHLACWDLFAALRAAPGIADWALGWAALGRPDLTEVHMRSVHSWFMEQALAILPNCA